MNSPRPACPCSGGKTLAADVPVESATLLDSLPASRSFWPLEKAQRAIVIAGCCAMAYTQLTTSPATVQFARTLGATGLHIGILGALPLGLVCMQLVSAMVVKQCARRKPLWIAVSIVQRMIFVPAALGPWLFPELGDEVWIWTVVGLTAVNHAMLHFASPLWLSWMGDYLPHDGLNRFWGLRHSSQQWTAALALLANALFFFKSGIDVRAAFAGIIVLGAVLGVTDILLFIKIVEPPLVHAPRGRLRDVLAGPFRHPNYRGFIYYSCFWNLASMVGAPFISMYLLEHVGMDLFHVLLLWTISWVGGAVLSPHLGQLAERYGQRPVIVLCTAFKSLNMVGLLICPADPTLAFFILAPIFMIDAFLNAGITIANNGFMIKNSPRENRTMFVAAGTGFAGIVGGTASILAGASIALTEGWSCVIGTVTYVNFHVLFAASLILRLTAALLATRIREPSSAPVTVVAEALVISTRVRIQSWQHVFARRRSSPDTLPLPVDDRVRGTAEVHPVKRAA